MKMIFITSLFIIFTATVIPHASASEFRKDNNPDIETVVNQSQGMFLMCGGMDDISSCRKGVKFLKENLSEDQFLTVLSLYCKHIDIEYACRELAKYDY